MGLVPIDTDNKNINNEVGNNKINNKNWKGPLDNNSDKLYEVYN